MIRQKYFCITDVQSEVIKKDNLSFIEDTQFHQIAHFLKEKHFTVDWGMGIRLSGGLLGFIICIVCSICDW